MKVENTSGLKPLGHAVLVKHYEEDERKGSIILPDAVKKTGAMIDQKAIIIEIGPCAWEDEPYPRAKVGDRVMISKLGGYMADTEYRLVNDTDIFALITGEKNV